MKWVIGLPIAVVYIMYRAVQLAMIRGEQADERIVPWSCRLGRHEWVEKIGYRQCRRCLKCHWYYLDSPSSRG